MENAPEGSLQPDDLLVTGAKALGVALDRVQLAAFGVYREEILRWSLRTNITALRSPADIVRDGFLDSLVCFPLIPETTQRILDIGSGAGFPALPIAIVCPRFQLTLVEASRRKTSFLRHMVRTLQLSHVRVLQGRAESLSAEPEHAAAYDIAFARAVGPPLKVCALARPFLVPSGLFLAQTGEDFPLGDLEGLRSLGLEVAGQRDVPPAAGKPGRHVTVLKRVQEAAR